MVQEKPRSRAELCLSLRREFFQPRIIKFDPADIVGSGDLRPDPFEDLCGQEVVKHDMRKRVGASILFAPLLGESVQPLGIKDKITDTVRLRRGVRTHSGPPVETGEIVTNTPQPWL